MNLCMCVYIYIYIYIPKPEPNRTGPDRATTRPKNAGRTASNRENTIFRTEPNRTDKFSKSPEPKRIEPNRFLPVIY